MHQWIGTCTYFNYDCLLQLSSGKAGLLAVKILVQCSKHLSSDDEVATILWARSSLEWSTLGVSSEDLPKLLSRHVSMLLNFHFPNLM